MRGRFQRGPGDFLCRESPMDTEKGPLLMTLPGPGSSSVTLSFREVQLPQLRSLGQGGAGLSTQAA